MAALATTDHRARRCGPVRAGERRSGVPRPAQLVTGPVGGDQAGLDLLDVDHADSRRIRAPARHRGRRPAGNDSASSSPGRCPG